MYISCSLIPTKAWQRNQVGSQTVEQSNRGRWARRTLRKSPKHERWCQQTVTGDSERVNSTSTFNSCIMLHELESYLFCTQQVSLRVCWGRPGRPAALFVQFGGRAREGGAASGEPASRQCVRPLHILRRRCPGPKVKTIPSCTSLPTHSCTVTIILMFWFAFNLFVGFLFLVFCCLYPCILGLPIHRTRWVQRELEDVSVSVFVFTSSPSATLCWVFVLPRSK